jgi:hypothetical protein
MTSNPLADAFFAVLLLAISISGYMFKRSADRLVRTLEGMIEHLSSRVADLASDDREREEALMLFRQFRKERLRKKEP